MVLYVDWTQLGVGRVSQVGAEIIWELSWLPVRVPTGALSVWPGLLAAWQHPETKRTL